MQPCVDIPFCIQLTWPWLYVVQNNEQSCIIMGNLWSNGNAKRTFNIGFAAPKIWFKTWVKLIMQWLKISWIQLLKFMSEFTSNIWANSRNKFSKRPKTDYFTQHFKSLWIVFELKYTAGFFAMKMLHWKNLVLLSSHHFTL